MKNLSNTNRTHGGLTGGGGGGDPGTKTSHRRRGGKKFSGSRSFVNWCLCHGGPPGWERSPPLEATGLGALKECVRNWLFDRFPVLPFSPPKMRIGIGVEKRICILKAEQNHVSSGLSPTPPFASKKAAISAHVQQLCINSLSNLTQGRCAMLAPTYYTC